MIFTVVGLGYVGMSLATLLSTKYKVNAIDIDDNKIHMVKNRKSPIKDDLIEKYFINEKLNLNASSDPIGDGCYSESNYIIIATPTDYEEETDNFNTESIEKVIQDILSINKDVSIIIKSTIPIGYTETIKKKFQHERIFFSPEFLREGRALYDNLYPSRIIVGGLGSDYAEKFGEILKTLAKNNAPVIQMPNTEAESVKLFSNTYLAMRVSFFNALDTFSEVNNLDASYIVEGVSLDPRVGNYYNNPSFGYGGYCLPKDTKQMHANFRKSGIESSLMKAIITSNYERKQHIANEILSKKPSTVGIYGLAMKAGSDNFRSSAIFDIINILKEKTSVVIYEESIIDKEIFGIKVEKDFSKFTKLSDIIVANRIDNRLIKVEKKLYTRDIFNEN